MRRPRNGALAPGSCLAVVRARVAAAGSILVDVEMESAVVRLLERPATRSLAMLGALCALLFTAALARAEDPPIAVVATIEPLGMLVRELGGERVGVTVLVPPGASAHTFEPVPSDARRFAGARLLVEAGGEFDAWAARLRSAAASRVPVFRVLDLPGLAPLTDAHAHPRLPGLAVPAEDPHVWLDPLRVRDTIAPALSSRLAALEPADRGAIYTARLAAFQERLTALDREIRSLLAGPKRSYVAFHAAWRYFGERYELEEIGVVERSAGEGPTPRELAGLVASARRARVPAILVEPQLDPRVARTLAREFGATVVLVDPNGTPDDPARARYEELMRWNARAFAQALGGAEP